jgi:hypothetical protein
MAQRSPFARNRTPRIIGKKFIIVCEGKTEYNYFRAIRISLKLRTIQIDIANPGASDPRSIVNEAIQKKAANQKEYGWTEGDTAWAVFDGDEHIQGNRNNWNDAKQRADAHGIKLAISNPCFELWFLLHFQDQNANLHRDDARRSLTKHLPDYAKGGNYYPAPLEAGTAQAIVRAEALANRIEREGWDQYTNPCTGIYSLVAALTELKK